MSSNAPSFSQEAQPEVPLVSMINQQAGYSNQAPVIFPNTYYNPFVSFETLPPQQMYGPGNYGPPGPYMCDQPEEKEPIPPEPQQGESATASVDQFEKEMLSPKSATPSVDQFEKEFGKEMLSPKSQTH